MANEKLISANATIQRALGIIEGVMLLADPKQGDTLETFKCTCINGMNRTVQPYDFCSYGERREGE